MTACSSVRAPHGAARWFAKGMVLAIGLIATLMAGETLAQQPEPLTRAQLEKLRVTNGGPSVRGPSWLPDDGLAELKETSRFTIGNGRDYLMFLLPVPGCAQLKSEIVCRNSETRTLTIPVLVLAQQGRPWAGRYLQIGSLEQKNIPIWIGHYNLVDIYGANRARLGTTKAFWIKIFPSVPNPDVLDAALVICVGCDPAASLSNVAELNGSSGPSSQAVNQQASPTVPADGAHIILDVSEVPPDYDGKLIRRLVISALRGPNPPDIRDIQVVADDAGSLASPGNRSVLIDLIVSDKALGGLTVAGERVNCQANAGAACATITLRPIEVDLTAADGREPVPVAGVHMHGTEKQLDDFYIRLGLKDVSFPSTIKGGHWKGSVLTDTLFQVYLKNPSATGDNAPKLPIAKPKIKLVKHSNGRFTLEDSEPAPRMVRVEFSGPPLVQKAIQGKLGEIRYNGAAVKLPSFPAQEGQAHFTLPHDFKITSVTSSAGPTPYWRNYYSPEPDYVVISSDNLDDRKETVVTIGIDWAGDLQFRVSDLSGIAATYGAVPMVAYDTQQIAGKDLTGALRIVKRLSRTIEVNGEYLVAAKVASTPLGFATLRPKDPRVIDLDFDKLQPGTDGDVKIDFQRRLPKDFQIQPVIAVGDKLMPYLQCPPYTIESGRVDRSTPLKRTSLPDGTRGLSLESPIEGQILFLKARCGDTEKAVELTPEVLSKKTKTGYAQVTVMTINRFYAGLAPSNRNEHESSHNWYDTLKFIQDLYSPLRRTEKVQSAVLAIENKVHGDEGIILPEDVLATEFPPRDRLPDLADAVFGSDDLLANFNFEQTLRRFKQDSFRDVTHAVIVSTPPLFSSCRQIVTRFSEVMKGNPDIKVAFINGLSVNPRDADGAFQPLQGSDEIFRCPGTPPQLQVYAFDAKRALQSKDGWKGQLAVLQGEIGKAW